MRLFGKRTLGVAIFVMTTAVITVACDGQVDFGQVQGEGGSLDGSSSGQDGTLPVEASGDGAGTMGDALGPSEALAPSPPDEGSEATVTPDGGNGSGDAGEDAPDASESAPADASDASTVDESSNHPDAGDSRANDSSNEGAVEGGTDLLSGTYTGYIESYHFSDGSDVITMQLALQSNGSVTGTVYFPFANDGGPLAPPTDPSVGYPPNLGALTPANLVGQGFYFTANGGTYAAPRLQLAISQAELWTQWCPLQTPQPRYANGDGGCNSGDIVEYGCLPDTGCNGYEIQGACYLLTCTAPVKTPIDCAKYRLCSTDQSCGLNLVDYGQVCSCTATGCVVNLQALPGISFDMQLTAGALNGSAPWLDGQIHNVHLTRVP